MITILENTLRDGSYVIDFQFDRQQTANITKELFDLGLKHIEVGHGLGLGAWNKTHFGLSKEDDVTYVRAAREAAPEADIAVFFIPGIGTEEDINKAIEAGVSFLRVGTNIDTYKKAEYFAAYAKKKGIRVAINLMKSYGVKSYEFTKIAREIDKWQTADVIYLVDSAGCMLPNEVFEYITRTKEQIATHLGFHGHNNMSLAVANSLQAIYGGATYIDTCFRGLGRSAGNAQTEIIVYLLQKMGMTSVSAEIYKFYDFANEFIVPLMPRSQGLTDEEIHIGISRFHTSYMPMVNKVVKQYKVNKKEMIKQVSDINCINPSEDLFMEVASEIKRHEYQ